MDNKIPYYARLRSMKGEKMGNREDYYTRSEAMKVIGVGNSTMQRYRDLGILVPDVIFMGVRHMFLKSKVDAIAKDLNPEGITAAEVAHKYGIARNTVKKVFKRQSLEPTGWLHRLACPVYDPAQVAEIARFQGWLESRSNAPLSPDGAAQEAS